MAETEFQRIVLLNRLVTRSMTRAPEPNKAPAHGALDLLKLIEKRREKKIAIEFLGGDDDDDEIVRAKNGEGCNFFRLRQCRFEEHGSHMYAILLMEFVDQNVKSFPVVNTKDFSGREISGTTRSAARPPLMSLCGCLCLVQDLMMEIIDAH